MVSKGREEIPSPNFAGTRYATLGILERRIEPPHIKQGSRVVMRIQSVRYRSLQIRFASEIARSSLCKEESSEISTELKASQIRLPFL